MKYIFTFSLLVLSISICNSQDRISDSLALVSIYQSLDGENWPNNENWLSDLPLDEWDGVRMRNNRVDDLELKSSFSAGISGDFPLQVLDLNELTTLEIKNIQINGPIPESLVQLTKLNRLVLESCKLNGDVPPIFDQFPNLRTLVLSSNELTGPIPALPQGMFLVYIDRNQFTGAIPNSWEGNAMSALQIHGNNLTGNFDLINTMPNISSINLSDNDWDESTLPLWLDDIPNLDRFSCDNCNLIGDIPLELDFSDIESYSGLFLSENELSGDITPLFHNPEFGKAMYMRLRSNNLSGELPVHEVRSFFQLDVYNNNYTSMTPPVDGEEYTLDILFNSFNYENLGPVQEYIALDSIVGVKYHNQKDIGIPDTITIEIEQEISIFANDEHPNTVYQWFKNNQIIEGETSAQLDLIISENSDSGNYHCKMTNENYPELGLRTSSIRLNVDLSTNTDDITFQNINVYPNPVSDLLIIDGLEEGIFRYSISSPVGNIICNNMPLTKNMIDVTELKSGVYILTLELENTISSRKFMKL